MNKENPIIIDHTDENLIEKWEDRKKRRAAEKLSKETAALAINSNLRESKYSDWVKHNYKG